MPAMIHASQLINAALPREAFSIFDFPEGEKDLHSVIWSGLENKD